MRSVMLSGVQDPETGDIYIDQDALEEIGGDDSEIGARNRVTKARLARIRRVPQRSAKGQLRVKSGLLGLGVTSVALSSDGTLDATAEEPCYLQRLVLDGDTGDFSVKDIKIGAKSIFSGTEAVPAGMFRPDATGAPFSFKHRMRVGQSVTLTIHNDNSGATKTLKGSFKTIEQA